MRQPYKKEMQYPISVKNEPWFGMGHHKYYPNMKDVYESFSSKYCISMDNFILTNGAENAFRWALLGMETDHILLETPTWGLASVICEAFKIRYDFYNYHYHNGYFYPDKVKDSDIIYTTDTFNNLFKHENIEHNGPAIIDETYTMASLNNVHRTLNENSIIIGSFSKFIGPGFRLGYCIFPDKYTDRMNMLREQYIGTDAADYILTTCTFSFDTEVDPIKTDLKLVSHHPVYMTFEIDDLPVPHKKFKVDEKTFCRIGTMRDQRRQVKELERLVLSKGK